LFLAGCSVVFCRALQLELNEGEAFRTALRQTTTEFVEVSAPRGRILAHDGTVLAEEREVVGLAVHYRYLQEPLDAKWLSAKARRRLSRSERRNPERLRQAQFAVQGEVAALHHRLASLCEIAPARWHERQIAIDQRVSRMTKRLNDRAIQKQAQGAVNDQLQRSQRESSLAETSVELASHLFATQPSASQTIVAREQEAYHLVAPEISAAVAEEIRRNADRYPGAKLVRYTLRCYPHNDSASQLIGYLNVEPSAIDDSRSIETTHRFAISAAAGVESSAEEFLKPIEGVWKRIIGRSGQEMAVQSQREPQPGRDVRLTIDPVLQAWSEQLLDRGLVRGEAGDSGAVVVMDINTGQLLTTASAPRFDPNTFARGNPAEIADLLVRADAPLLDRCSQMALPPGSVFKPLVAIALLESGGLDPFARFTCQGFLDSEDAWRCALFRRQGIGHGDVNLAQALAQSCNVYFFHHGSQLGSASTLEWARRFGFGQSTASGIAGEAAGNLPSADSGFDTTSELNIARGIAIGQHEITATPLQVTRMMAAIANGGRLVQPTIIQSVDRASTSNGDPKQSIAVQQSSLLAVRTGLLMAVDDRDGTAHDAAWLPTVAIAGKTGTAQSGADQPDHAWFAGYVPAERPQFAFCVALEHGGEAASAATIARQVVQKMLSLGMLKARD